MQIPLHVPHPARSRSHGWVSVCLIDNLNGFGSLGGFGDVRDMRVRANRQSLHDRIVVRGDFGAERLGRERVVQDEAKEFEMAERSQDRSSARRLKTRIESVSERNSRREKSANRERAPERCVRRCSFHVEFVAGSRPDIPFPSQERHDAVRGRGDVPPAQPPSANIVTNTLALPESFGSFRKTAGLAQTSSPVAV